MEISHKEVMLMKQEYILLLLNLIEKGLVSSITVSKTMVVIRIKKDNRPRAANLVAVIV